MTKSRLFIAWAALPLIWGLSIVIGVRAVLTVLVLALLALGGVGFSLLLRRRDLAAAQRQAPILVWLGVLVLAETAVVGGSSPVVTGPFPAPLASVAVAGVVLVGLGFFLLLRVEMRERSLGVLLEAVLCVVALSFIPWALAASHAAPLDVALRCVPPMVDAVVLWICVRLLQRRTVPWPAAASALSALFWLLAIDIALAVHVLGVSRPAQDQLEAARIWAACVLGAVALLPAIWQPVDSMPTFPRRLGAGRVAAPLGLTLVAPALFALQAVGGNPPPLPVVLGGSSLLAFLVAVYLVRQVQEGARAELRANHDPLTGLPNRAMFHDRLEVALAHARRSGTRVGIMFLDLDRFKSINDSLGHAVGNQLLQRVANRLQLCVRAEDTVARMGGDEFMVLLPSVESSPDCVAVAEKLLRALAEPFLVNSRELVTSTSIGIAMFPDNGQDADALTRNADIAMYRAKANGRNAFQICTHDLSARAKVKHSLESRLRAALENDELELHYQPKIETTTDEIVGLEALARWPHEQFGFIPPAAFIPLAEETGLIVPLGEWVLEKACTQIREWSDTTGLQIPVAINVSAREFTHRRIDNRIADALDRHGLSPNLLELEITESIFMHDLATASDALFNLRNMGVRCSIDDFGTGYSGLTYLTRLPIYSLKIDQSFIKKIGSSFGGDRIVDAVITLARSLGMRVIAEGVETDGQKQFLFAHGCDEMQGHLFCPPLSPLALDERLGMSGAVSSSGGASGPASGVMPGQSSTELVVPCNVGSLLEAFCTNEHVAERRRVEDRPRPCRSCMLRSPRRRRLRAA